MAWPNSGPGLGAAGAGAGGAANTGAAAAASSGDAAQCRALAEDAVQTETGINEDIAATRRNDWERAEVLPEQAGMLRDSTADRARAIFETCMSSAARPAAVH
ncbi:MAG: hypothetical protein JO267_05645 [Alphaproteobacteria bacterium]|nr:hypothetical protein [Alphaproteobacteria bacterium]